MNSKRNFIGKDDISIIPDAFLNHAANTFAEILSGSEIVKYMNEHAVKYDREIPFSEHPFLGSMVKKSTALSRNLSVFSDSEKYFILTNLFDKF